MIERIQSTLLKAAHGEGSVAYIEAAPDLMSAVASMADATGLRVLRARGAAQEREFPFGVAIQLFEDAWFGLAPAERARLLEGPARGAGELLAGAATTGADHVTRGLFWLARELAQDAPLALLIDDAQLADPASLRFLGYLARRINGLPIVLVVAGRTSPARRNPAARTSPARRDPAPAAPRSPRQAQLALQKSLGGAHRETVVDLVEHAWADGALLHAETDPDGWPLLAGALLAVDELERAVEICAAAERAGRIPTAPEARVAAHYCRAWSAYHQGRIADALALAHTAVAGAPDVAHVVIAACRLEQDRVEEADEALSLIAQPREIDLPVLLDVRAQLRLAQRRPAEALEDAREAGRRSGAAGPSVVAWRSTAALALLALGQPDHARALTAEELELARERGIVRVVVRDLRVLAFAAQGRRRLDLLTEAVNAAGTSARLEHIHALVDLGAAIRRANQRTAARVPLRKGLEVALSGGATALAARAHDELAATGARARRAMLSGAEALTPSERRVADLAAGGLTTRQIAETLFVTPKTVEFHLRHVYRKLDIASSREELARALAPAEAVAPSGGVTPAEAVAPSGGLTPAGAVAAAYPDNLAPLRKESPMTSNPFRPRSPGGAGELRDHRRRSRQ